MSIGSGVFKAFCRLRAENGRSSQAHRLGLVARNMIRLRTCHTRNNDDLDLLFVIAKLLKCLINFIGNVSVFIAKRTQQHAWNLLSNALNFRFFLKIPNIMSSTDDVSKYRTQRGLSERIVLVWLTI